MKELDLLFKKYSLNELSSGCSTGSEWFGSGQKIESFSPVDGELIGEITSGSKKDFDSIIEVSKKAFKEFREIPAPTGPRHLSWAGRSHRWV